MLKILTGNQIKKLDEFTIQHEPIASIDLMERACRAFLFWFIEKFDTSKKVDIVCGTGNNGGDGAGIARLLNGAGYNVCVWIVGDVANGSEDFKINLKRIPNEIPVYVILTSSGKDLFKDSDILIDALFGSGLSRPVAGVHAHAISLMNQSDVVRIAVDVSSGLMLDTYSSGVIVKAHHTVSFELPKFAFFMPENNQYTGAWYIVPIGLSKTGIEQSSTSNFLLEKKDVTSIKKVRSKFDHKGTYGHALLITGSYGKMGASILSSKAAIRSGLGLLTTHIPKCGYAIMQTAVPESMVNIDSNENIFSLVPPLEKYNTIGIGPGLGTDKETVKAFTSILENYKKPMVIDADALNMLSENRYLLNIIPEGSLLTPHPKEFQRLAGEWKNDFERLEKLKAFAHQTKSIIILKGAYTTIASPSGDVYFNPTGNPGMATGGSGDVLTGLLTGLLPQNYSSLEAAIFGVYLHGLAGDLAADAKSMEALVASDIVDFVPHAFQILGS